MLLGQSLRMLGRADESRQATREGIRRAEHMLVLNPSDGRALSLGSGALFEDGQAAQAAWAGPLYFELYPGCEHVDQHCLPKAGRKEEALELLERVFARGWGKRDFGPNYDPDYDILRDDPRFQQLLSKRA